MPDHGTVTNRPLFYNESVQPSLPASNPPVRTEVVEENFYCCRDSLRKEAARLRRTIPQSEKELKGRNEVLSFIDLTLKDETVDRGRLNWDEDLKLKLLAKVTVKEESDNPAVCLSSHWFAARDEAKTPGEDRWYRRVHDYNIDGHGMEQIYPKYDLAQSGGYYCRPNKTWTFIEIYVRKWCFDEGGPIIEKKDLSRPSHKENRETRHYEEEVREALERSELGSENKPKSPIRKIKDHLHNFRGNLFK